MWDLTGRNAMAASATLHCLTGCAVGEVLGLLVGTAAGLSNTATIGLAVALAFLFGYGLSIVPLLSAGVPLRTASTVVLAADTLSIAVMEVVDNLVMAMVPGAMNAGLVNPVFWLALMLGLAVAFVAAFPVNRFLIDRGKGHALTHRYHAGHGTAHSGTPAGATDARREGRGEPAVNTKTISIALAGFIFGGLLVSVAAQLDNTSEPPQHADVTTLTS